MADKITIFKEVFDYYYDGEITKEQLADLLLMHYETRWGNGVDVKEIEDKDLRMIWRTLQHSVIKSTKNAKQYEKQQNKKSALQNTVGDEFNIPQVANNIPSNEETENKPVLAPQIPQDDNQCQEDVESGLNSLKMGNNEIVEDNKENNIEDMGNLLVFDETTGQYKYPSKTKEQIKEKILEKNLPTVQVAATAHTPNSNIPSFQDFLKETAHTINDIIEDFKAGGIRATKQAPTNLKEFLNTKLGRFYKEEIEEYIKARVNTPVEEPAAFVSDEDKYGNDVMDFIEDNQEILDALKATVDYFKYNEEDKELAATNANEKINSIVSASGRNNGDFITRLEMFCKDYSVSYDESKMNRLNNIEDAA